MPFCVNENVALVEICEYKYKRASAETQIENRLKNCSHRSQHGQLVSTVSKIIHSIRLMPKTVVMNAQYINHVGVNSRIGMVARYIS